MTSDYTFYGLRLRHRLEQVAERHQIMTTDPERSAFLFYCRSRAREWSEERTSQTLLVRRESLLWRTGITVIAIPGGPQRPRLSERAGLRCSPVPRARCFSISGPKVSNCYASRAKLRCSAGRPCGCALQDRASLTGAAPPRHPAPRGPSRLHTSDAGRPGNIVPGPRGSHRPRQQPLRAGGPLRGLKRVSHRVC